MTNPTSVTSLFTGSAVLEDESKVLEDYVIGQRIGEGSYGSVYVVKYIPSGEKFALKVMKKEDLFQGYAYHLRTRSSLFFNPSLATEAPSVLHAPGGGVARPKHPNARNSQLAFVNMMEKLIIQEATVTQSLEHPHVVKLYKFLNSTEAFYFIMELAEGGELFDLIISKQYFAESEARHYFQQLISAIDYCHRSGIAHKDLKAENLLLDRKNRLLVCDFGFSTKAVNCNVDDLEAATSVCTADTSANSAFAAGALNGAVFGTMHYMSPEAVLASTTNYSMSTPSFAAVSGVAPPSMSNPAQVSSPLAAAGSSFGDTCEDNASALARFPVASAGEAAPAGMDRSECACHQGRQPTSPLLPNKSSPVATALGDETARRGPPSSAGGRPLGPAPAAKPLDKSTHAHVLDHAKGGDKAARAGGTASPRRMPHKASAFNKVEALVKNLAGSFTSLNSGRGMRTNCSTGTLSDGAMSGDGLHHYDTQTMHGGDANDKPALAKHELHPRDVNLFQSENLLCTPASPVAITASATPNPVSPDAMHVLPLPLHTSPTKEVILDAFQEDLWGAAVILFFMLTGRLPFEGRDEVETLYLIQNIKYAWTREEETRISQEARQLVQLMLAPEPTERLSLDDIIFSKWFVKGINLEADFPHRCEELQRRMVRKGLLGHLKQTSCGDLAGAAALPRSSFLDFSAHAGEVTPDEEQVIEMAFRKIDSDGYGKITRDQVRDMLTTLHGDVVAPAAVSELVNLFTGSPLSEAITFTQFRNAWVTKDLAHIPFKHSKEFQLGNIIGTQMDEVERQVVRQLRVAFDSVDKAHVGVIELKELKEVFQRCGIEAAEEDIVSLVHFFHDNELVVRSGVASPSTSSSAFLPLATLGVSFDAFVLGIVQRDILLRHPLGRKLAAATNLTALFHSHNVTECVRHGFFVVGLQNVILEKLTSVPERLVLLYFDEVVSQTENLYSFRYGCSSSLINNTLPAATTTGCSLATHPSDTTVAVKLHTLLKKAANQAKGGVSRCALSSCSHEKKNDHAAVNKRRTPQAPKAEHGAHATAGSAETARQPTVTTSEALPVQRHARTRNGSSNAGYRSGEEGPCTAWAAPTAACCSSITHRTSPFGSGAGSLPVSGVCDLDIILAPVCMGYTLVQFRRIRGYTSDFHDAVAFVSNLLDLERQKATADTMPQGESELM